MATVRSNRVSRARYTSPIPPAPSGPTISYGPSFDPEVSVIIAGIIASETPGEIPSTASVLIVRLPENVDGHSKLDIVVDIGVPAEKEVIQ